MKLNHKDLAIDDFVLCGGGVVYQIDGLYRITGTLYLRWNPNMPSTLHKSHGCVCIEDIAPVPLTENILFNNGFDDEPRPEQCMLYTLEIEDKTITVHHYHDSPEVFFVEVEGEEVEVNKKIYYVHQLQEILRLCGIFDVIKQV